LVDPHDILRAVGGVEGDGGIHPLEVGRGLGGWYCSGDIPIHAFDNSVGVNCLGATEHDVDDTLGFLEVELIIPSIRRLRGVQRRIGLALLCLLQLLLLLMLDSLSQPSDFTTVSDVMSISLA
jgi:hypothetical protein